MYHIRCLVPRNDHYLGNHGFCIDLHPSYKDYVLRSGITQDKIDFYIKNEGNRWLDCLGYNGTYNSIDELGNTQQKRIYEVSSSIKVEWGEWGLEHILVPGNACTLDLEKDPLASSFKLGARLEPHNIDSWSQKNLMLLIFTQISDLVIVLGSDT